MTFKFNSPEKLLTFLKARQFQSVDPELASETARAPSELQLPPRIHHRYGTGFLSGIGIYSEWPVRTGMVHHLTEDTHNVHKILESYLQEHLHKKASFHFGTFVIGRTIC